LLTAIFNWALDEKINLDQLFRVNMEYAQETSDSTVVFERREDYMEETSREIINTIRDLDIEAKRDVLKYARERKQLAKLKTGKHRKTV